MLLLEPHVRERGILQDARGSALHQPEFPLGVSVCLARQRKGTSGRHRPASQV